MVSSNHGVLKEFHNMTKRLLALGVLLGVTAAASLTAAQKPAPPQPTEQQKLKERVDALESQLKETQAKADRAAMEKDYITRVQKQYEAYYKEVFSTQTHILWTIGITVTLLSVTLSVVFFVAGRFGFNIFDRRIDLSLEKATAQLRTEFTQMLEKETHELREDNQAQLTVLVDDLTNRITQEAEDLKARSQYQFQFAQALGYFVSERWPEAVRHFRMALGIYKKGKPRDIFAEQQGQRVAANIFRAIKARDKGKVVEAAKKELEMDIYKGLEHELNFAATEVPELAALLQERRWAPSSSAPAQPKTEQVKLDEPPPATPEEEK